MFFGRFWNDVYQCSIFSLNDSFHNDFTIRFMMISLLKFYQFYYHVYLLKRLYMIFMLELMFESWYTNFTLSFSDIANFFRRETWHWVCFVDTSITFKPNFAFVNSMMSRVPFGGISSQYRILLWQIVSKCCFIQVLGISDIVKCSIVVF